MKPYPRMKESGVEWIGKIPEHWEVTRLKRIQSKEPRSFVDGNWIEAPFITDKGIRLIQTGNIGIGEYKEKGFRFISEETFKKLNCNEIFPDDVLICRLAEPVGRACLAPKLKSKMITSVDVAILKPSKNIEPKFVVYFLTNSKYFDWLNSVSRGSTRQRISRSMLGDIDFILPSLSEQKQICSFLKKEISKIDFDLEKNKKLSKLLDEKRASTINHAIIRGLKPSAKMENSGITWIGKIPKHWEIKKLKMISVITKLTGFEYTSFWKTEDEGEILAIRGENIGFNELDKGNMEKISKKLSDKLSRSKLFKGDIVFPCTGSIGNAAIILEDNKYHINQNVAKISSKIIDPNFLVFVLLSNIVKFQATSANTSGIQPVVLIKNIRQFLIPIPPKDEQKEIAEYLAKKMVEFDNTNLILKNKIQKLTELRQSIITSTVTGQIDVRETIV